MLYDLHQENIPIIQDESKYIGGNKMHSRHQMFRMPEWMSEDDDVSNLASRIPHGPNWTFGNRGNFGKTQHPGENELFNRGEPVAHTIPIRIEAEAPPGWKPEQNETDITNNTNATQVEHSSSDNNINPEMRIGNQPAYASKTAPSVESCVQEEVSRDARSSSAPPEVKDKEVEEPRYITKVNITPHVPQQPQNDTNQTFNNIAKPFPSNQGTNSVSEKISPDVVDNGKAMKTSQSNVDVSNDNKMSEEQQPPQPINTPMQKTSVIRNIPILFEGNDGNIPDNAKPVPSPPTRQHNQPRGPNWDQQFGNRPTTRFADDMFQDPFFGFNRFGSPKTQRREQHIPDEFSQHDYPFGEQPQNFKQQQQPASFSQPAAPIPCKEKFKESKQPPQEKSQKDQEVKINKNPTETPQARDVQMEKIIQVRNSLIEHQKNVAAFNYTEKNKEYRYLDEMLTRSLLELDNIEPNGRDDLRQARRTLIKDINICIGLLEKKVTPANKPTDTIPSKEASKLINDAKKTKIEADDNKTPEVSLNENNVTKTNSVPIKDGVKINTEKNAQAEVK